ncbi:MAG: hypothetical protein SFW35_05910 [Chitinophagales bacterium]|nr:hypothetical protein [Chitinophagales bacterium]
MEALHKELELIQAIIGRMAQNSFQVKAWLIGVLGAMLAFTRDELFATGGPLGQALMMNAFLLLPILCFWYLDAFFLSTERLYRELYKWVVQHRPSGNTDYLYDLNTFTRTANGSTVNLLKPQNSWQKVAISKTLWPFYGMPLLFVIGLMAFNVWSHCNLPTKTCAPTHCMH